MSEENKFFKQKGDIIYLIAKVENAEYLNDSIETGFINTFHLISTDGIYNSLVECSKANKLGFDITSDSEMDQEDFLYDETKYTAIIAVDEDQEDAFVDYMYNIGEELTLLGHVTKGALKVDDKVFGNINDYVK